MGSESIGASTNHVIIFARPHKYFPAVSRTRITVTEKLSVARASYRLYSLRDWAERAAKRQSHRAPRGLPSGVNVTDRDLSDSPLPLYTKDTRRYRGSSARFLAPSRFGTEREPRDITAGDETNRLVGFV